jgi:hypothetical protein
VVCEDADESPSLPPEHCTLAPNVKTCDSNVSIFLSNEMLAGEKKRMPYGRDLFAAANKMRRIAARVPGELFSIASPLFAQRSRSRYQTNRDIGSAEVTL